ncbi:hypothetical protein RE428_24780 [Marinobacter nanhaiticus D15-8W]|uniref:DUF4442 domain-containing protein n=1 Tax=Marinobacter nanhaiticus D15-8W TaxID=626887 RepID=N6WZ84_9GAMM|nr:DUF4442 domain-containing protein [Marinobacter nanhaiticus]ENO14078.1 DUF4442 domain-containing protein [Marinobacter nanhaiticus D15-8W]BES71460.1 hypothetical protein RE428_24780 [Marinobacter nanhaiticus D15-8W]
MAIKDRLIGVTSDWLSSLDPDAGLEKPWNWLQRQGGYRMVNRLVGQAIPFAPRNRFRVEDVRPGYVRARISIKGNRNHFGSLYAGAYFLVAEIPGGVLTLFDMGPRYIPILKEMSLQFLQPSDSDVTIELQLSEETRRTIKMDADTTGRAAFTLEGELKDTDGNIVARSTAHYRVKKQGFEAENANVGRVSNA